MDVMGVDVQSLSVAPYQLFHWVEGELGLRAFRVINDDLAELVRTRPDRFLGLGQSRYRTRRPRIEELRRCSGELGFPGIEVTTHIEGEELSSPRFEDFWAVVEELGMVVFIHPTGFTEPSRFTDHYFQHHRPPARGDHLCRPSHLRRRHGASSRSSDRVRPWRGFLPSYAGRFDHAYHARADVRHGLPRPPSEYLSRFYFDSMVFEADQLGFLVDKYGSDHILLGTDYPYDMGEPDPIGLINKVSGLSPSDVELIVGTRLLGIGPE